MTPTEYRRWTLQEMQARRWRTRRELRNGRAIIPAGTAVEIERKYGGLELVTASCGTCGVRVIINGVEPMAVEEIR